MANNAPAMRPAVVTTRVVQVGDQRQEMRMCNEPGCLRTHYAQGLCAACYQRARYQADPAVADRKREQMRRWRASSANEAFRDELFTFPEDHDLEAEFTGSRQVPRPPAEVTAQSEHRSDQKPT